MTVTGHVRSPGRHAAFRKPRWIPRAKVPTDEPARRHICGASDQAGTALQLRQVSRGLAVRDLFNHGDMDIAVENLESKPMIQDNQDIAGRHWVSFELAGTKSNCLAVGSQLKIIAGGITQTQRFTVLAAICRKTILSSFWHRDRHEDRPARNGLAVRYGRRDQGLNGRSILRFTQRKGLGLIGAGPSSITAAVGLFRQMLEFSPTAYTDRTKF
jgi:hypothetical protein